MSDLASTFRTADPFPHIVIDDWQDTRLVNDAAFAVPPPSDPRWQRYKDKLGSGPDKLGMPNVMAQGGPLSELARSMGSPDFVGWLSSVSGIQGLRTDPDMRGAGLHSTCRGGSLGVHVDFSKHRLGMYRRLNAFLYLNWDWNEGWGGDLELWRDKPWEPAKRIAPIINRLVVFECGPKSWHGHPYPLACPANRQRNSLAAYYFTDEKPRGFAAHSTIYRHA